ncbi:MAG TPA: hypothetical protein VD929_07665 [Caulobacteraceae bacterium]|nr:hypothetical protein [Caulobacteraceae bacterium]
MDGEMLPRLVGLLLALALAVGGLMAHLRSRRDEKADCDREERL